VITPQVANDRNMMMIKVVEDGTAIAPSSTADQGQPARPATTNRPPRRLVSLGFTGNFLAGICYGNDICRRCREDGVSLPAINLEEIIPPPTRASSSSRSRAW